MPDTIPGPRWSPRSARAVDVALALALLLVLAPLLLALALAVRLEGGPVLFTQVRLGRGGRPFRMHKFRTLSAVEGGPTVATATDARATLLGRALRRSHLDELPQLVDVLRGAMALVGPRPEVPANLVAVPPEDLARTQAVRPGMTGPTQLAFAAEDEVLATCSDPTKTYRDVLVPAKVRCDLAWLPQRTLCRDLATLLGTPFTLASRRARATSRERVRGLVAAAATTRADA